MWDLLSFFLGLFVGMLIITLLGWFAYLNKSALFAYCATSPPTCASNDYYSDPGQAVTVTGNPHLYVKNGILYYVRLVKNNNCVPNEYQVIPIHYPEYCQFTINGNTVEGKQVSHGSNNYDIGNNVNIVSGPDCTSSTVKGVPLPKWDPRPI